MKPLLLICLCATTLIGGYAGSAQREGYDYFEHNRQLIRNGLQAVLQCNGLITSRRSLEEGFDQWDLTREVLKAFAPAL